MQRRSEAAHKPTYRELEAKLERSNAEFALFAYAAAHDLQEPLHKIVAFGEMLERRLSQSIDEQSRDYLTRMRKAAERQHRLIDDLLRLARITTQSRPFEDVDTAAIVREATVDIEVRRAPLDGRVEIGKLPRLYADPAQMRQLFQVLLDNAIKFRRLGAPAHVEVSGRELKDGLCEIVVKDSGIGFDEKYLDRIFKPFHRLHSAAEYDGTGIGLAIADKIVARHEGTLTARSSPGSGASFVIRLPAGGKMGS